MMGNEGRTGKAAGTIRSDGGPVGSEMSAIVFQRFALEPKAGRKVKAAGRADEEEAPGVSAGPSVGTYMLQLLAGITNGRCAACARLGALGWGRVAPRQGSKVDMGSSSGGSMGSEVPPVWRYQVPAGVIGGSAGVL